MANPARWLQGCRPPLEGNGRRNDRKYPMEKEKEKGTLDVLKDRTDQRRIALQVRTATS